MSILTHGRQTYLGTAAERGATTPDAEAVGVRWFETDTSDEYVWDGSGWVIAGSGAWKLGEMIVVSASGDGDYTTIAAAIAVANSGDTILVDAGQYTCDNQTLPSGVDMVGHGITTTDLITTTANTCLTLAGTNYLNNLYIRAWTNSGADVYGIKITGAFVRLYGCTVVGLNNGGAGDGYGIHTNAGAPYLMWCDVVGQATGGGDGYGLYVDGADATVAFGRYEGVGSGGYGVYLDAPSAAVEFMWPQCSGADDDIQYVGGTAPEGWYLNDVGLIRGVTDGIIEMDELAATPANPATNSWRIYFLNDGLYYLQDDGTEVGPLS